MAVKKRVCVCVFQICILFVHTLTTQMQRGSRFHCFFVIVSKLLCISLTTYHFSRTSGMGLNKKYTHKHQPTLSSPSSITSVLHFLAYSLSSFKAHDHDDVLHCNTVVQTRHISLAAKHLNHFIQY